MTLFRQNETLSAAALNNAFAAVEAKATTATTLSTQAAADAADAQLLALSAARSPVLGQLRTGIIMIGDSRTDRTSEIGPTFGERHDTTGYMTWLRWLTGGRVTQQHALNFGISGNTTADVLARLNTAVEDQIYPGPLGAPADVCIVLIGTNDCKTPAITPAMSVANLRAIRDAILDSGRVAVFIAENPRGDTTFTSNRLAGAELAQMMRIRSEIMSWQGTKERLFVADPWPLMADPASANGDALLGMNHDGLHPSPQAARAMGLVLAPIFNQLYPPVAVLAASAADQFDATNNPLGALNTNPMMLGTGGTRLGSVTGNLADNWVALSQTGLTTAVSKVTGADGRLWQQVTWSGTPSSGNVIQIYQDIESQMVSGIPLIATCEFEADAGMTGVQGMGIALRTTVDSVNNWHQDGERDAGNMPGVAFSGVSTSPVWLRTGASFAAGSNWLCYQIQFTTSVATSGTVRFRAASVRRVSA